MLRVALAFLALIVCAQVAAADRARVVGFRVRGDSKLTEKTLGRLAHVDIGDMIDESRIPAIEQALISSELFESVKVTLEEAVGGGIVVVATLDDKLSWFAAPTLFLLPSNWAVGAGYIENNLFGEDRKMLLYGQLGNRTSLFFGTYLDPAVAGSKWQARFDVYLLRKIIDEYNNDPANKRDFSVGRSTLHYFLDAGALVGYRFHWWLIGDFRLRGAYVYYRDPKDAMGNPVEAPEKDGWDWSVQARMTLDKRHHEYGVKDGPYLQMTIDQSIPGLDSWGYTYAWLRAYYSKQLLGEHELELRSQFQAGRHLPFHEEFLLGGVIDLRGYDFEQFRGDLRATFRVEYSVPMFKWRIFAFRALGFWDTGYIGFHFMDASNTRRYLPGYTDGIHWWRNDVGAGLRVYVKNIVLPLLGLDIGYGIEGHSPEVYFELGLTDF